MPDSPVNVRTTVALTLDLNRREDPRIWGCVCGHNYQYHADLGYVRGRCEHGRCSCPRFRSVIPNAGLR